MLVEEDGEGDAEEGQTEGDGITGVGGVVVLVASDRVENVSQSEENERNSHLQVKGDAKSRHRLFESTECDPLSLHSIPDVLRHGHEGILAIEVVAGKRYGSVGA